MNLDWLDPLLTSCPGPLKAMGYLQELRGIRKRYQRCREEWAEHVERTRSVILRGVECCRSQRKAVVFGGGLLHDIPLEELSRAFREVILVDLVHPFHSRWMARHLTNVRRLTADVTATIDILYRNAWEAHIPLPRSEPRLFLDDPELDFTASVNLLSQLPCVPMTYLSRQGVHSPADIDAFARHLIDAHLRYLSRLPGMVTLISDVERLKITLAGQIVERRDLLFGATLPTPDSEWEWRLAPCPEADPRHHYYRRVVGIAAFRSSAVERNIAP
jgi:hypothetical protein